jgi:formate dehydrogenase major subunit
VVCDIYPEETSDFWRSPGVSPAEMKNIKTEVYRLPGAGFAEKDGTFVNSARWLQWKWAAVPPPGDAKLDQEILTRIFLKVRELYRKEGGKFPDPILNLAWNYTIPENPSLSEVARELNGRALADVEDKASGQIVKAGQQLPGFAFLRDDGSTLCGNWIWSGSWTEAGALTQRRGTEDPSGLGIYPNWAWSWPMPIAASCITALRAMWRASRGMPIGARSGGTKRKSAGPATTSPTSRPILRLPIIWARSS